MHDRRELITVGPAVLDDGQPQLELDGNLADRRQNHDRGSVSSRGGDGQFQGLNDLRAVEEPMEVPQNQQQRTPLGREAAECADHSEGIAFSDPRMGIQRFTDDLQTGVDVPGRQDPGLFAAKVGDLGHGVVRFDGLDPESGEPGAHELPHSLFERHSCSFQEIRFNGIWKIWPSTRRMDLGEKARRADRPAAPNGIRR